MTDMSRERFEELVREALDTIPADLATLVDNCVVLVEDEPPHDAPGILGVYDGVPLSHRDSTYTMRLPDRVTIFRRPILEMTNSEAAVVEEVRITVVHEIAHHFGIDDARLHELGYG